MKILHLCSDFANQKLYKKLVAELSELNILQSIYVPVRSVEEVGKNMIPSSKIDYNYSFILNTSDRILYYKKIRKIYSNLCSKIDVSKVSLTHAHFLFSDGGVALKMKREHGIPYVVAVRNTDLNVFFKYLVHLRSSGIEILEESERIIFLSPAYRDQLYANYIPRSLRKPLLEKSLVIPNGIDEFWLQDSSPHKSGSSDFLRILYVGNFSKNKNVNIVIKTVLKLNLIEKRYRLTLVGGGGSDHEKILKLIKKHRDIIEYHGKIDDIYALKSIYKAADVFIMPSKFETFGLVYIEAMSQGVPVIYSRNQGIDGYFVDGHVGFAVNSRDIDEIVTKTRLIESMLSDISNRATKEAANFSWKKIAKLYEELYIDVSEGKKK